MKIIGITGGVGAGKSTVLDYLEKEFNACVLQADKIGHLVMEPDGICYDQVIALFGKKIIKNDKTIDRKIVSDVVFAHEEMRQKLDHIIHPAVKRYILDEIEVQQRAGCPLMVVEAALLLEDHYDAFCDKVWYIHTDRETRDRTSDEQPGLHKRKGRKHHCTSGNRGIFPGTCRLYHTK